MANSHYISRFLTKPWEHGNNRDLTYYDFERKKIYTEPSKRLYAEHGLFSDELERFFNEKIERLANDERDAIVSGKTEYTDFKRYRAWVLLILLQGGRTAALRKGSGDFSRILNFDDSQIDQLVLAAQEQFKLITFTLSPQLRLYYPNTGVFAAMVQHNDEYEWLICLPLTPQCVLALLPTHVPIEATRQLTQAAELMNYSAGASPHCTRVVIHPDLLSSKDHATLARAIEETRGNTDTLISALNKRKKLMADMDAEIKRIFGDSSDTGTS